MGLRDALNGRKDSKQLASIAKRAEAVSDKPGTEWGDLCDQAVAVVQRGQQRAGK